MSAKGGLVDILQEYYINAVSKAVNPKLRKIFPNQRNKKLHTTVDVTFQILLQAIMAKESVSTSWSHDRAELNQMEVGLSQK